MADRITIDEVADKILWELKFVFHGVEATTIFFATEDDIRELDSRSLCDLDIEIHFQKLSDFVQVLEPLHSLPQYDREPRAIPTGNAWVIGHRERTESPPLLSVTPTESPPPLISVSPTES